MEIIGTLILGYYAIVITLSVFQASGLEEKVDKEVGGFFRKCRHGTRENKVCNKCESERKADEAKRRAFRERQMTLKSESKKRWESERRSVVNYYTSKLNNLKKISPKEFEATVSRLYTKLGYETTLTKYVGDEGKDIIAKINGKTYFIECKQYGSDSKVSRTHLQKLFGAMSEHKVDGGILVTTSDFTVPAIEYSERDGIEIKLINKEKLRDMFQKAYHGKKIEEINLLCKGCGADIVFQFESNDYKSHTCECGQVTENNLNKDSIVRMLNPGKNQCIKCGSKMKLIDGRYGEFYGCSRYPKCDHTVKSNKPATFEPTLMNQLI
jgi:HJR/Mrr/RecB family endonuclease